MHLLYSGRDLNAGALNTIQHQAGLEYGLIRSPCAGCPYVTWDKNDCLGTTACRLARGERAPGAGMAYNRTPDIVPCPMEGCDDKMRSGSLSCHRHSALITYRRRVGVPPDMLYMRNIRGWRKKHNRYDWGGDG